MADPDDADTVGTATTVALPVAAQDTLPAPPAAAPRTAVDSASPFGAVVTDVYTLEEEIGRGGMGRVVAARDRRLRRTVAIKELLTVSPAGIRRFEREALITARLSHPAVVPLYEAGCWPDGRPFYGMKRVSGKPLDHAIADAKTLAGRMGLLPSVLAVVDALAYAHGQRIIHRDLKPGNVLVGEFGEVVVIDWGLAKDLADTQPEPSLSPTIQSPSRPAETVAGAVLGTPSYMPPEQAAGSAVDERADVYALGAMLYHVLAGEPPYGAINTVEVIREVVLGPPRPLSECAPGAPADLVAIVDRAMARAPADRYPTAKEMAADLRRFLTGQLVGSYRYSTWELVRRWLWRHRGAVAITAAAVLALGVLGAVSFVDIVRARDVARTESARAVKAAAELKRQRDAADAQSLDELEELAREALAQGRAMEAAAYLVPVYTARPNDPGVRFQVARAVATVDPLSSVLTQPHRALCAVYSPDGRWIATGGSEGDLRIWNASTGTLARTLETHTARVTLAAYAPDGARVVTTSQDEVARVWDLASGKLLLTLAGHTGAVRSVAYSPDGTRIVTAGDDRTARVWNAATGALLRVLAGHRAEVYSAAFSPDGTRIATASWDATARIWDARTGALLHTLTGHAGYVYTAAFSPDGSRVVTAGNDKTARVWDAASGTLLRTLVGHTAPVLSAAFSPDGARIATASTDGTLRIWDAATGSVRAVLQGRNGALFTMAFAPDGAHLVTASDDWAVRIWTAPAASRLPVLVDRDGAIESAVFSPDGTLIATAGDDATARIWDATSGELLHTLRGHAGAIATIAFSPDGSRVVTASQDRSAREWDVASGTLVRTLLGHKDVVYSASYSPDGREIVTASLDGTARVWDAATGATVRTLAHLAPQALGGNEPVIAATYSPDGRFIATACADGKTRIWEAATGGVERTLPGRSAVASIAYGRGGSRLLTATIDGLVRIWDPATGALVQSITVPGAGVGSVVSSPDGSFVATAGSDGVARVWDATTGRALGEIPIGAQIASVAFSPDGKLLVVASADGAARVFDVHEETRPPAVIAALVATHVPFRLEGARLVPLATER